MPFMFDDSKAEKKADVLLLFQDSFINRYSKKRKTPVFTSSEAGLVKPLSMAEEKCKASSIFEYYSISLSSVSFYRANCQTEMKLNGSELSLG